MKNLLFFTLNMCFCYNLYSQGSLTVEAHDQLVDPICCTTIFDDYGTEITVKNISEQKIDVKVSREVINASSETENYFCWVACYSSSTNISPHSKVFAPQQEDATSFQVHFDNLNVNSASAIIRYCAFVSDNPSDSSCTMVYYSGPTSIENNLIDLSFSEFYPNPSSTNTFLDYQLPTNEESEVVITDMLGNMVLVKKIKKNIGRLKFDISQTKPGIYFANIIVEGELKVIRRLVISK